MLNVPVHFNHILCVNNLDDTFIIYIYMYSFWKYVIESMPFDFKIEINMRNFQLYNLNWTKNKQYHL